MRQRAVSLWKRRGCAGGGATGFVRRTAGMVPDDVPGQERGTHVRDKCP